MHSHSDEVEALRLESETDEVHAMRQTGRQNEESGQIDRARCPKNRGCHDRLAVSHGDTPHEMQIPNPPIANGRNLHRSSHPVYVPH
eukprot:scaffold219081_cov32-Tisochrysis_lutea.AAC.1